MHLTKEQLIEHALGDDVPGAAAHVLACAECENEVEIYREVMAMTRDLPGPPPGYSKMIWDSIRWRLGPPPRRRRWMGGVPVLSAAAALLATVAGPAIWQMAHVRSAPDKPAAQAHIALTARPSPHVTVPAPPATQVVSAPQKKQTKAPRRPPVQKKAPSSNATVVQEPVQTAEMPDPAASLAAVASNDPSVDSRIDAIRKLGLQGPRGTQYLVDLYRCEPESKVRLMIANTLLMQNKPSEVEKLAAREKDRALANTIRATVREFRARINEEYLAHDRDPGAQPPR